MENILHHSVLAFVLWVSGEGGENNSDDSEKQRQVKKKERKTFEKRAMRYVRCDSTNNAALLVQ